MSALSATAEIALFLRTGESGVSEIGRVADATGMSATRSTEEAERREHATQPISAHKGLPLASSVVFTLARSAPEGGVIDHAQDLFDHRRHHCLRNGCGCTMPPLRQ